MAACVDGILQAFTNTVLLVAQVLVEIIWG
jgi:hypothetical protein